MKVHLRINYGCDKRFFITKQTIEVCHPHFETIRVLVSSTEPDYQMVKELERDFPKLKVSKAALPYLGELESIQRNLMWDVPENEWVHVLDSDERPSALFLNSLQEIIADAIANGIDVCRIATATHHMVPDKFSEVSYNNAVAGQISYAEPSLLKYNRHVNTFQSSYGGCHSMPARIGGTEKLYFKPTLHVKNPNNWTQALLLQGFFNPTVHSNGEQRAQLSQSSEYAAFEALKAETKCFDSSNFVDRLSTDPEFKEKWKGFLLTLKDSKFPIFSFAYKWVAEQDFKLMVFEKPGICGKACCKYGDIQL